MNAEIPTSIGSTSNAHVPKAWGVAALVRALADALSARFNPVTVRGEITGFSRAASGHCYFTLKDTEPGADSAISCAMFRRTAGLIDFAPKNGDVVELRGRVAVYEARGSLQLVAEHLQKVQTQQGQLWARFEQLKLQLSAEGLFDEALKRPIPRFVRCVAVVTSRQAAALQDVLTALARRAPHVAVRVFPCAVQGADAPGEIVQALSNVEHYNHKIQRQRPDSSEKLAPVRTGDASSSIDAVLLVRGGGSLEDLWAFNDASVVRAVRACGVPLICGVGHETDFSLSDFAADLRAPTPTAAAELVSQPTEAWLNALDIAQERLRDVLLGRIDQHDQRLDQLTLTLGRPQQLLHRQQLRLDRWQAKIRERLLLRLEQKKQDLQRENSRFTQSFRLRLAQTQARLDRAQGRLDALNPQRVLERGYALLQDDSGKVLSLAQDFSTGQAVTAQLQDGRVGLSVKSPGG